MEEQILALHKTKRSLAAGILGGADRAGKEVCRLIALNTSLHVGRTKVESRRMLVVGSTP